MWTKAHRARHEARLKNMVKVGAVARWLERADPPRSPRRTPLHRIVAALAWHLRVGGPWRALPGGFPPWRTIYGWFRRWLEAGLLEALMQGVARLRRRSVGRRAAPRLCIIDTQVVKCISVRGPRGYDAGKGVWGRKRVALVDAASMSPLGASPSSPSSPVLRPLSIQCQFIKWPLKITQTGS